MDLNIPLTSSLPNSNVTSPNNRITRLTDVDNVDNVERMSISHHQINNYKEEVLSPLN
jgi:hypothetical protein